MQEFFSFFVNCFSVAVYAKGVVTLNVIQKYLYTFSEFVEHALRLQAQSERRLSAKGINILEMYLIQQLFLYVSEDSFGNFFIHLYFPVDAVIYQMNFHIMGNGVVIIFNTG